MEMKRPGRPRDESIDAQVVDALFQLVEEQGLAAVTIDAVAERAGVSKATIYRRWASKEELIVDSVTRLRDPVVFPDSGEIREVLVTGLSGVLHFMSKNTAGVVFPWLLGEVARGSEIGRRFADAVILPGRRGMAEGIRHAMEQGELRPDLDVEIAVDMLTGPAIVQKLLGAIRPTDPDWIEKLVDNLLEGWKPR
jgi:AcrR family transcriptional regulator